MPSFATQEPDRYLDVIPAEQIAAILEGPEVLGHPVNNLMDLDEVVAQGIPRGAFDALVAQLAAHSHEVARGSLRYRIVPWGT